MAAYQQGQPISINDTFRVAGTETDPTQVVYTITGPDGVETQFTWPGAAEITHVGTGVFSLAVAPPALPGIYHYDVDATGAVVASRTGSFTVLPDSQTQDVPWVVSGPMSAWASSQDVWACCGQPTEVIDGDECPVDFSQYVYAASELLFELSGRLFFGLATKTVRPPCRPGCGCGTQVLSRGHVISTDGWWGASACDPSKVLLSGYPLRAISEVKIDGAVLATTEYGIEYWRWLVRKNSGVWPSCQDLSVDDTEDGTWSVTYQYGQDPPLSGQLAATELGCELYKACSGGECAMPTGVTRIIRQGVVIEKMAFAAWGLQGGIWRTGLTRVDAFLNAVNPNWLKRRPTFWSPARHLQYAKRALV
jgi:hypothetical protein